MTSDEDLAFMIARAMARFDGHQPDDTVIDGTPLQIMGRPFAYAHTAPRPIYMTYLGHAQVAIAEFRKLKG